MLQGIRVCEESREDGGKALGTGLAVMGAGVAVRQDHTAEQDISILFDVTLKSAPQPWPRHLRDICYSVGVCVGGSYPGGSDPEDVWELDAPVTLKKAAPGSEVTVIVQARITALPQIMHAGRTQLARLCCHQPDMQACSHSAFMQVALQAASLPIRKARAWHS